MEQTPNTDFYAEAIGLDTGQAANISVKIRRVSDEVDVFTNVAAVGENPAGSGRYVVLLTSPNAPDQYTIIWFVGEVAQAYEDLTVTGGYVTTTILPGEILASLSDINANLPNEVGQATSENSAAIQVSVARIVRGYLSRVIDNSVLLGWNTPDVTPETIREAAAKLIASQVYFNNAANQSPDIPPDSFAQKLYNEGMAIINGVIGGAVVVPGITTESTETMTVDDFFPQDSTDRSFTMGMKL